MIDRLHTGLSGLRAAAFAVLGTLCVLWLGYLLFQTGHAWDESEHAHVAWLMSQGKRPIDDFFQHHQPLLWDVLSIYYRAGFSGAGVLIWGRVLVVLSGLVSVWALLSLGRTSTADRLTPAGLAGVVVFIALTLVLPPLLVSRPETLSTACMLAALALWHRDDGSPELRALAAGVLAGAACYASPRFIVFGGFFALLSKNTTRRWALLIAGGVLFVSIYTQLSGFSLEKVLFNLRFSGYLQSVGDFAAGLSKEFWVLFVVAVIAPMLPVLKLLGSSDRLRGALLIANLLAIFFICDRAAGLFRYVQAYAPFVVAVPVVVLWLIARVRSVSGWHAFAGTTAVVILLIASAAMLSAHVTLPQFHLVRMIRAKNELAALVPAGRTVLLYADRHPITVWDASYYGTPLFDARDRLCKAVSKFRGEIKLPPCGYLNTMQRMRPYLLDARIDRAVKIRELSTVHQWIGDNYAHVGRPADLPQPIRDGVLVGGTVPRTQSTAQEVKEVQ